MPQIIPFDGTPGAKEAGCIHFIDRALETFDREKHELYRSGLAATQKKRAELFLQSYAIAGLESSVKDAWGLPAPRITFQRHPDDIKKTSSDRDRVRR